MYDLLLALNNNMRNEQPNSSPVQDRRLQGNTREGSENIKREFEKIL